MKSGTLKRHSFSRGIHRKTLGLGGVSEPMVTSQKYKASGFLLTDDQAGCQLKSVLCAERVCPQ